MVSRPRPDESTRNTSDSSSNSSTTATVVDSSKLVSEETGKSPLFRRHRMKITKFFRQRLSVDEENREVAASDVDPSTHHSNLVDQTTIVIHPPDAPLQEDNPIDTTTDNDNVAGSASNNDTKENHLPSLPAPSAFSTGSYFEQLCGVDTRQVKDQARRLNSLPDDPSVQESIECVVTAQQDLWTSDIKQQLSSDSVISDSSDSIPAPSGLHQCFLKNRSVSRLPPQLRQDVLSRSPRSRSSSLPSRYLELALESPRTEIVKNEPSPKQQASIVPKLVSPVPSIEEQLCTCCDRCRPVLEPEEWPQRPLLLRPTPNGGTIVKGIRFSSSKDYLWTSASDAPQETFALTWPDALRQHWQREGALSSSTTTTGTKEDSDRKQMCSKCMILPINNGKELPGESLVTDFESDLFRGSILVRLKDCQGTTLPSREQAQGYFHGLHRRYQVVIRGKFKQAIPWTELIAGFQLERSAGKLPPKWIVNGALNIVRFFAPQLQTNITGARPYSLTPLGSTPQSLIVQDSNDDADDNNDTISRCDVTMEMPLEEPREDSLTLLGHASTASSSMQRARHRKKHFDKLFSESQHHHHHSSRKLSTTTLMTDPRKLYTFEFLQHLLSFDDFSIELGSMVGSVPLQNILHGQPLQIMASHGRPVPLNDLRQEESNGLLQNRFWCFDIWHEMLIADAKSHEEFQRSKSIQPTSTMDCFNDGDSAIFCQPSPST